MNKEQAEKLMEALAWMELPIQMAIDSVDELDTAERKRLMPAVHEFLKVHFAVMMTILKEYPELDPQGLGEDWYYALKQMYQTELYPAKKPDPEALKRAAEAGKAAGEQLRKKRNE